MLEKLLKTLKNTRPDADWAIFGSAARGHYERKEMCREPTALPSDIDIVTNARTTREGFTNLMRGCFEILDIEFGEQGQYDMPEIRKRVKVHTLEYGTLDFVFITERPEVFSSWYTDKYQAGSLSQCTFEWNFLRDKYIFITTPAFRVGMVGGDLRSSSKCTGTEQYWRKQYTLSDKIKKSLA